MIELSKDDLSLLMDSYKKQIELNTQVLTQQQNLIAKMDMMIEVHRETCNNMNKIVDKIDVQERNCSNNAIKITEKMGHERKESLKEHNAIINRIYIAFVGMGVIIINLIALYLKK